MLAELIEKGYVLELDIRGETYYRVRLVSKQARSPLEHLGRIE